VLSPTPKRRSAASADARAKRGEDHAAPIEYNEEHADPRIIIGIRR